MSERKVLNKYYPPDFDPSKIPKIKGPKNRTFSIRIMAPFNMRCENCGEYIYKGKKFNSRKETVEDEDYLGLRIFRFYIKCPRCVSEIAFKTDLVNTDYTLEAGAKRNFEASKTAELMAKEENKRIEEEELNNPMKVLENRTAASQFEMEQIEALGELKELNARHAEVNYGQMLELHKETDIQLQKLQDEEDEKFINSLFGKNQVIKRLSDADGDAEQPQSKKIRTGNKPTDILTQEGADSDSTKTISEKPTEKKTKPEQKTSSTKQKLSQLIKKKPSKKTDSEVNTPVRSDSNSSTEGVSSNGDSQTTNRGNKNKVENKSASPKAVLSSGLGLLGDYSDSDNGESD